MNLGNLSIFGEESARVCVRVFITYNELCEPQLDFLLKFACQAVKKIENLITFTTDLEDGKMR